MKKRTILDAVREKRVARGAAPAVKQKPPPPPPPARPAPAPAPPKSFVVTGYEGVTARCGHPAPFDLRAGEPDAQREKRREKKARQLCPDCRDELQRGQMAEAKARRRRGAWRDPNGKVHKFKKRLPHGATFHVTYDAETETWSGTLEIPGVPPYVGHGPAVFGLLHFLDDLYRADTPTNPAPDGGTTPAEAAGESAGQTKGGSQT